MKASDISTEAMLTAIQRDMDERKMWNLGACTLTTANREGWPVKVVAAKLRKMARQGIVDGCRMYHNCRGDWLITPPEK